MYHETTRETILKTYGFPDDYAISSAVVLGIWNTERALPRWRDVLADPFQPPAFHNLLFGQRNGRYIGFGAAYGATFAADVCRFFQLLGARRIIQIGFFGGLQPGMQRGDVIVPAEAIRADGASDAYLPPSERAFASEPLSTEIASRLSDSGIAVHRLPQISIVGGIFSETREHIAEWSGAGYGGVDLETATTFAVAQRFGLERAAMLVCSDVIVDGDTFFTTTEGETRERYLRSRDVMEQIALDLACTAPV